MNPDGNVHLIGAGGAGMGALAHLLLDLGTAVSASDEVAGEGVLDLRGRGLDVAAGHRAENLPADVARVVYSLAVPPDNVERRAARQRGIAELSYPSAVARLLESRRGIGVAGTHGKTTTTALVAHALRSAGADPSWLIGGVPVDLGGRSGGAGGSDLLVVEACEYRAAFHAYPLEIGVVLNVEPDHLDWYEDEAGVIDAFETFAARPSRLIASRAAASRLGAPGRAALTFDLDDADADVTAVGLTTRAGRATFALGGAATTPPIECPFPGRAFAEDVLAAATTLSCLGIDGARIARGLSSFSGVGRRLETLATGAVTLISDYAHHPTELDSVASAMREAAPGRRLVAVFEPHQVRRTTDFMEGFAAALGRFDVSLVVDVFAAREPGGDAARMTSERLVEAVVARGGTARAVGDLTRTTDAILAEARPGDVILLLGAGTIDGLRHELRLRLPHSQEHPARGPHDVQDGRDDAALDRAPEP